jgi:hypothetical protein
MTLEEKEKAQIFSDLIMKAEKYAKDPEKGPGNRLEILPELKEAVFKKYNFNPENIQKEDICSVNDIEVNGIRMLDVVFDIKQKNLYLRHTQVFKPEGTKEKWFLEIRKNEDAEKIKAQQKEQIEKYYQSLKKF